MRARALTFQLPSVASMVTPSPGAARHCSAGLVGSFRDCRAPCSATGVGPVDDGGDGSNDDNDDDDDDGGDGAGPSVDDETSKATTKGTGDGMLPSFAEVGS
jgi:hypothetical protein